MILLKVSILIFVFTILHELGHVICSLSLKLKITDMGFAYKPFPHFYVSVKWPYKTYQKVLYLFSGFFVYLIILSLFLIFYSCNITNDIIKYALFLQLIIETNPIYSDFVIVQLVKKIYMKSKNSTNFKSIYKEAYTQHLFSKFWYLHFFLWTLIVFSLIKMVKS